jgi:hypothetical protein
LLLTLLHVAVGDGGSGVGESVEVKEDLVSRLLLVDVVDRQVQIVRSNRTLGTLVHKI